LHVVVTRHGYSIDPDERESHSAQYVFSKSKRNKKMIRFCMNKYFIFFLGLNKYKRKVYKKTKNLLTGSTEKDEEYQKVCFLHKILNNIYLKKNFYLES
jgi:hypothetical protein